jgi:hypothetical protein
MVISGVFFVSEEASRGIDSLFFEQDKCINSNTNGIVNGNIRVTKI